MRRWADVHRLALIVAIFAATAIYIILAVISEDIARTVGIGYLVVLITLFAVLRLHGPR